MTRYTAGAVEECRPCLRPDEPASTLIRVAKPQNSRLCGASIESESVSQKPLADEPPRQIERACCRPGRGLDGNLGLGWRTRTLRVGLFTREYPPQVYGGAGVHVDYLSRELAKEIDVEVHCWGPQLTRPG